MTATSGQDPDRSGGSVQVLHVDPDERARAAVEAAAATRDDVVAACVPVVQDAPGDPAEFDVVVTDVDASGGDLPGAGTPTPVVLYTAADRAALDEAVVAAVETVVGKRGLDDSAEFLLDKVVAAVGADADGVSQGWRVERTEPADAGVGAFLLDEAGTVLRRGRPLDDLLPGVVVPDADAGGRDLVATLAAVADDSESLERRGDTGDPVEGVRFDVPLSGGESRRYEYWEYPVEGDGADRIAVVRDVTAKAWHRDQQATFELLVQNARDGIYMLDETGTVTYLNESFADMLGYEREELLGVHGSKAMAEGELQRGQQEVQRLLETDDESSLLELRFRAKDGRHLTVAVNFTLLPRRDGDYAGLMGVVRDVTDRKRRERQLQRQRERLDEFASVVAHDLRNPLAVVQGNLETYRDTGDEAHLDEVAAAADRMEALIDDLLELARQGEMVDDVSPVEMGPVADRTWERLDTGSATLRVDDPGSVRGDPDRLGQLLANLFRNAVEHSSTSSRPEADDAVENGGDGVTVTVGALADDGGFYVADDGPGIPPDEREQVFDRGYTTRKDGTGFGLAIVETIADAHGWTVDLTDSAEGGARFEIRTE